MGFKSMLDKHKPCIILLGDPAKKKTERADGTGITYGSTLITKRCDKKFWKNMMVRQELGIQKNDLVW